MKSKTKINKRDIRIITIAIIAGLFFGWLFFHGSGRKAESGQTGDVPPVKEVEKKTIWTCSMHPQIRMDHPGKCPICGMDLIPLGEHTVTDTAVSPDEIQMTEAAVKIADVQTIVVQKAYPDKEVYLLGKVKPDERNIAELTARYGGRIEKLYINFTGQQVKQGEQLASVYSPALLTAQRELLEAKSYRESNPEFYKAARNKLKLWDLSEAQIDEIEQAGEVQNYFDVLSPITGTITRRDVAVGDYLKEGDPLFRIIDLDKVWVMFEAYESDLPWMKMGDRVNFTVKSIPGENFSGKISFIDPVIDPQTRIANVRVEVQNKKDLLKPGMFVNGVVTSSVAGNKKDLMIPKTSVLWTGKRAVVYVKVPKREQPTFKYREINLGPEAGDFYVVADGLQEGEEIAVNGVFKIDASAQLAGKPSMMNPEGGKVATGHQHGGRETDMGTGKDNGHNHAEQTTENKSDIPKEFKQQLTIVYESYIPMKNAFVETGHEKVTNKADVVMEKLEEVDMELLSGEAHSEWMEYLDPLKKALDKIAIADNIELQREVFADFNLTFYKVMKRFGLSQETVYYQYCPMAFSNKGAYWFSEQKEIRNPYFGEKMMKCGETREEIDFKND